MADRLGLPVAGCSVVARLKNSKLESPGSALADRFAGGLVFLGMPLGSLVRGRGAYEVDVDAFLCLCGLLLSRPVLTRRSPKHLLAFVGVARRVSDCHRGGLGTALRRARTNPPILLPLPLSALERSPLRVSEEVVEHANFFNALLSQRAGGCHLVAAAGNA